MMWSGCSPPDNFRMFGRFGNIDAIWMDAGATAVAALEALDDAGKPYPIR